MENKKTLRAAIRARKRAATAEDMQRQSKEICERILQHPQWKAAKTILLYHQLPDEVDTQMLLKQTDKCILLPVVMGEDLELRINDGRYAVGAFGIQEPVGNVFSDYEKIDLAIVPGMAFDRLGHRLGRGKGYYDKLFAKLANTHLYKLGICYDFQLLPEVPAEAHDIVMDEVCAG